MTSPSTTIHNLPGVPCISQYNKSEHVIGGIAPDQPSIASDSCGMMQGTRGVTLEKLSVASYIGGVASA